MPPEPASAPESLGVLIAAFVGHLRATGRADDRHYARAAERFFARWPDPPLWAAEPLEVRLAARTRTRMLVTFLMLHGHLRPGYDYLIARRFISLRRELATSPLRDDMDRFVAATRELGFADTVARGAGSLVAVRLLVQTGKPLAELTAEDLDEFESALGERDQRTRRPSAHYRRVLFTTRSTLYHLGFSIARRCCARPASASPSPSVWPRLGSRRGSLRALSPTSSVSRRRTSIRPFAAR